MWYLVSSKVSLNLSYLLCQVGKLHVQHIGSLLIFLVICLFGCLKHFGSCGAVSVSKKKKKKKKRAREREKKNMYYTITWYTFVRIHRQPQILHTNFLCQHSSCSEPWQISIFGSGEHIYYGQRITALCVKLNTWACRGIPPQANILSERSMYGKRKSGLPA